jgi:uroporphyrinogen decarboxylase
MSRKQDFLSALTGRKPVDAVPIWELEFHAWEAISGRKLVLGAAYESLPPVARHDALARNADILISTSLELKFAALTVPGAFWDVAPGELAFYCLPGDAPLRQLEVLAQAAPDELALVANTGGVLGMPGPDEFVEFCYQLYDEPEAIDRLAGRTLVEAIAKAQRLRAAGADAFFVAADMADSKGPFMKPGHRQRFVLPYLKRWVDAIHSLGTPAILHSDGNLNAMLDELAATGIDGLQALDPVAGMDIRQVQKRFNQQLCLCGNVDCGLLLTGSPESVYRAAQKLLIDCKGTGDFILGATNAVQPSVPTDNYLAMIEAWQEGGQYQ